MRSSRLLLVPLVLCFGGSAQAQKFTGVLAYPGGADQLLVLWSTRGAEHLRYDSTTADAQGRFAFAATSFPVGFYQLSVHDSDRVDIILNPADKEVDLEIEGTPLQYHVMVRRSEENKRLWAYKLISRQAQAVQAAARQERMALQPTEIMRMRELDSIQYTSQLQQQQQLTQLLTGASKSYFARTVGASRMLDVATREESTAMASTFPFSDPAMLRSSVYDKAVSTYLQATPPKAEKAFYDRIDSLMLLAGGDPECRTHVLGVLVDMFATYGPDLALQHVVDRHIAGKEAASGLPPELMEKVRDLLTTTTGAIAPDVRLPQVNGDTLQLTDLVAKNRYTALFFYSSTCDHCHLQMPVLINVYANYRPKGFGVVGIALDTDSTEFVNTLKEEHLSWPSFSELRGWGSPSANAFNVSATPTFFLLDAERRIVAKPVDAEELGALLSGLLGH